MADRTHIERRTAMKLAAAATAATIVPRAALGGPKHVAPSEKVIVGFIGCGTQGFRQLMPALKHPAIRIAAVCDPNRRGDDYPEWSRHELNNSVAKFLGDPNWAQGARGGLCGREIGQDIVSRHYAKESGKAVTCPGYADFREMLDKEKGLDAVYIMTPEHLHGVIAARAMRQGKHVLTHKPIANVLAEVRAVRDLAKTTGVATQLHCTADKKTTPMIAEWLAAGAIGPVREVHNWSSRPFWPQGMLEFPKDTPPVPDGFNWDLWLGPAAKRAYHPAYTHAVFRGWFDFGTGALGDMGHYSFHQIFQVLKLGTPVSVEASRSQYWDVGLDGWHKRVSRVSYPQAAMIHWEFPARGEMPPVTLHWYDGGLRPAVMKELEADGVEMPAEGLLFVGDGGKLVAGFSGDNPRLLPQAKMKAFTPPPQTLPRPLSELDQFVRACRGEAPADASFEAAYPFAETILLGTIAVRVEKKLKWDSTALKFANSDEANALITRKNRPGWEL